MSQANLIEIRTALEAGLSPLSLTVADESHLHAGHIHNEGRADGGITHVRVSVVAEAFAGKSRVDRHRMVNALLAGEMAKGLHALAIVTKAPGE